MVALQTSEAGTTILITLVIMQYSASLPPRLGREPGKYLGTQSVAEAEVQKRVNELTQTWPIVSKHEEDRNSG